MKPIEAQANVFGRVATIAGTWRLDVAPLLDKLTVLAPELGEFALVTVPHTFDRIAVACRLSKRGDSLVRAGELGDREQIARIEQLAGSETRELDVEVDSNDCALAFRAFGHRDLAADLGRLASFGVAADTRGAVATICDLLVGPTSKLVAISDHSDAHWTLQVEHANRSDAERADTRARLDAAAKHLAVTTAQRNVVASLHDVFASDRSSYSSIVVRRDRVEQRLGVMWAGVAWEHVVRMMLQFYPGGATSERLGELAGAFDAEVAAAVELVLGPGEPPEMRVAVTFDKGRT